MTYSKWQEFDDFQNKHVFLFFLFEEKNLNGKNNIYLFIFDLGAAQSGILVYFFFMKENHWGQNMNKYIR